MSRQLAERLLALMDRKDHWAWPHLARPGLSRAQLLAHFGHEHQVYVRDFPVLLARVLGQGPPAEVRRALAENIYEEQTGGLSLGVPHPDLFVEMMEGLGLGLADLESVPLEPEAVAYRRHLDEVSARGPWVLGHAALTLFVEGSRHERDDLAGTRVHPPVEEAIRAHPVVAVHGCPPERMRLVRAHRMVEGDHRADAWRALLAHVPEGDALEDEVVAAVARALELWLAYRDGVARAMGLARPPGAP
jgi:pyrroloquinoline quinone (PQQ) biosynthesis protein C